ncbi:MAG: tetratricopeptide repeat protein [Candidatus Zixiibacteriota bacterium]
MKQNRTYRQARPRWRNILFPCLLIFLCWQSVPEPAAGKKNPQKPSEKKTVLSEKSSEKKIESDLDPKNFDITTRKLMLPGSQLARLQTARNQMKLGDYVGAADLLELIYRDYPLDPRVVNLLRDCYVKLKRYFSAIEILKRQFEAQPLILTPLYDMADVYFKAGKGDSALLQVEYIMGYAKDAGEVSRYSFGLKRTMQLLLDNWQDTLTLTYARSLRDISSDSVLFAEVVAEALERQRDFRGSTREAFKLLRIDTTKEGQRRRRGDLILAQLLSFPDAQPQVTRELKETLEDNPTDTLALKYLAELYMKTENFEPAFEMYARFDSLSKSDGRQLMTYLRECYDRKLYTQARRMGEFILDSYPKSPILVSTRFFLAHSLHHEGDFEAALRMFELIGRQAVSETDRAEAVFNSGEIMMDDFTRSDSARALFEAVTKITRPGLWRMRARFRLAQLDLIDGDSAGARRRLQGLGRLNLNQDLSEKAGYYLARLDLFEALLDSAQVGFKRVIEKYPRGLYVNDALSALMVLQQGAEGDPELLNLYGRAEYYRERRIKDSLIQTLDLLAEHEDTSLADVALLDLGKIYLEQNDTARSLEYFSLVSERFPESYFAPFAGKYKGDIYLTDLSRRTEALAIYRALLKDFGTYPFAAELREKLKTAAGQKDKTKDKKDRKAVSEA